MENKNFEIQNNVRLIPLSTLKTNTGQIDGVPPNPRLIKNKEFEELINSILVFPKMLFYRPITYAGEFVILGGNQRKEALIEISKLSFKKIKNRLEKQKQFTEKPEEDRAWTLEFWEEFCRQEIKQAPAQDASGFSIAEMSEFVIKDNVGFGEDDFEVLEKHWDIEKVTNWGLKLPENWEVKESEKDPFMDDGIVAQNQYGVIIVCASESEQEQVFNKMQNDGYICKIVVT